MAISTKPSDWLGAGYLLTSHSISFNTNDASSNKTLPQLTDAKANATTGDIRQVSFAIDDVLYQYYLALSAANKPVQMHLTRSVSGDSSGNLTFTYSKQYTLTPGGIYTIPSE